MPNTPLDEAAAQQLLVSVVIVCYNQGAFLAEAIQSTLDQTYGNVELIVVDDGSTDDTASVSKEYRSVRYIRQENAGLSAARNAGLAASRGRYLVFLDADDRLLRRAVESGVKCFGEYPEAGFIFGGYRNVYGGGAPPQPQRDSSATEDYYLQLLRGNFIGMHATVMYRREMIEGVGGFNIELRAAEDFELFLRIARRWEVRKHGSLVADYRKHSANMSADRLFMLKAVLKVLDMERRHISNPEQMRALRSGRKFYKEYYGSDLLMQWRKTRHTADFLTLMRWYPTGVLRGAVNKLKRNLGLSRRVLFGSLQRLSPFSRQFGFDRGKPVDRVYIESFLNSFSADIRGAILEIGDDHYSRTFGGSRVSAQDVLHITPGHPGATIIADLSTASHIPSDRFDCIICTQTLHLIYDFKAAVATLHRILKPGGVLLATVPGISQVCRDAAYPDADSWRFTASSALRLLTEFFGNEEVRVQTYGNVLTATAFLYGLAAHELKDTVLDHHDADYPLIIGIRAQKEEAAE